MNNSVVKSADLQRCLNGPYLFEDDSKRGQVQEEVRASQVFYEKAVASFNEKDEATGLKEVWAAMYRAARALAYKAGYRVEQLHCMQVVLREHFSDVIAEEDIHELVLAQELAGPPDAALARARTFMDKVKRVA